jgi:DNA-binding NarL/FixJ family response regulator
MSTTVLIVDDHAPFRSFARALLQADGFSVVGDVGDGASALREVQRLHPDVVLLDIQLPDIDGFEVTRQLAAEGNHSAIVLISSRDASDYRRRLAGSGARGFIAKSELSGASLDAVLGASG